MPTKVLIVEDDGNIAELLHLYLEKEGYDTQGRAWSSSGPSGPTWCCWTSCCL